MIHQILDNTNGGINVVDTDGILVYVNNVSANYLNQKRENMIGKHISQFYPAAVLLTVLENHRPILDKKIHLVPPNKYVVNSYPIFMDGEFMGAYSIFQDIQEIDQLNSKIKHLEMQVSLTKPEADFQHVVHMGTMQNIYKQAKKIVGSLGGPRHSIITGEPGTGKTAIVEGLAQRIVAYREEHGPFADIESIMDVNGIGEGIFETIRQQITVEDDT